MYVRIVSREEALDQTRRAGGTGARVLCFGLGLAAASVLGSCDRLSPAAQTSAAVADEPSPPFRNVESPTAYVGDSACATCHAAETSAYREHAMARSFHGWTPAVRVESPLDSGIVHGPTGLVYTVVEDGGQLFQVEYVPGPEGRRLHELRRRIDWVTGSGAVARTYFTEENGRLFQLPLTWYRRQGWDFSPGYQLNNARFDRSLPDRCVACHASYPEPLPFLEGKYAELRPGIGCERCHGPGALHVQERRASVLTDSGSYDNTIVNPAHLPLARRLDVCEQCHVHTTVSVLREGKDAFGFMPSQALRDHWAFFKVAGSIDIVSHADRLRQSACFLATRTTPTPLECATCHTPHQPPADAPSRNQPCQTCHSPDGLRERLGQSPSLAEHAPSADCVGCHMPSTEERGVPHGSFTDHWIRVVSRGTLAPAPNGRRSVSSPIEPYFDRDRQGAEAEIYRGMGGVLYATLANDARALGSAASALDRALGPDTTRGEALFLLGAAYEQLGRTADAIRVLERSVRGDSSHPDRLRALAHAYRLAGRAPAVVEALYRRALSLQPALAWIRADYADFLHSQGRLDDAIAEYRAALAEQPSLSAAWFDLGTLFTEAGRVEDASDAFRRSVTLDPLLGEALSSLFEVRTGPTAVTGVDLLASPLPSLPVRDRGPRAIRLSASSEPGALGVRIFNVPPRSLVRILEPDGSLVRALPPSDGWAVNWDLRSEAGAPIGGGLYRIQVQGRDPTGRPFAPQIVPFGVVRKTVE